jgi:catechol 2,3-dioxygenase-like lactoylglutathione lyase family enzyme
VLVVSSIHHVALPVTDLARAKAFYGGVLGLREVARPPFSFAGAWFEVGDRILHLIVNDGQTFRAGKAVDTRDIHFAIRVASYRQAIEHLHALGYTPDAADEMLRTAEQAHATAGFPQVFLLDPDRNVVELNAEALD